MKPALLLLALAVLATIGPATASEAPPESYLAARAALEQGDPAAAARLLRRALGDSPRERAGPPSYLPHFYLGLAQQRLGNCLGALREWRASLEQGAIAGLPEAAELARERAACETRLVAPQLERARAAVTTAEELAALGESLRTDPALAAALAPGGEAAERLRQGQARARTARASLEVAERDRDLGAAFAAQEAAAEAERALTGLADDILAAARAPRAAPATRAPVAAPGALTAAGEAPGLDRALRRAAPLYFSGEYAAALAELQGLQLDTGPPRARAAALLLRAAARWASQRGRDGDASTLDAARADARAARRADPTLVPSPELFPPELRSLWSAPES